ncbi:MAG TPA: c-type cytochrome domain-containing protein, partial [Chitinophagaceae bacterium]|nr:c-type cytochrome domain-containing protein [Chitinophagaceae bacterium]
MKLLQRIVYPIFFAAGIVSLFKCRNNDETISESLPEKISYNFDIRPILSDKCLACHGPDANKRKAGLRLDDPESAFAALKESPGAHALIAGKPYLSQVFLRITSKDTESLMPPVSSNLTLTQHE